jgi:hypothetical protein
MIPQEIKSKIEELVRQGTPLAVIKQQFPDVDGRVIAGIQAKIAGNLGRKSKVSSQISQQAQDELKNLGFSTTQANYIPKTDVLDSLGFNQASEDYFLIEKLDGYDAGIKGKFPIMSKAELATRLPDGEYLITFYKNGMPARKFHERISRGTANVNIQHNTAPTYPYYTPYGPVYGPYSVLPQYQQAFASHDPIRLIQAVNEIYDKSKQEQDKLKSLEVQKDIAKTTQETDVTKHVLNLLKENQTPQNTAWQTIIALMQEDRKTIELKHEREMQRLQEEYKLRMNELDKKLEFERERLNKETELFRQSLREQSEREKMFLAKLQELEQNKSSMMEQRYNEILEQLKGMHENTLKEIEKEREHTDQLLKLKQDYMEQIIKLKESMSDKSLELEKTRMITEAITKSLNTVSNRIETAIAMSKQNPVKNISNPVKIATPQQVTQQVTQQETNKANQNLNLQGEDVNIKSAFDQEWFNDLKQEIIRTVKRRIETQNPALKPHGSILAISYIDQIQTNPQARLYLHYLMTRSYEEVMQDIQEKLSPDELKILQDKEAKAWFDEFQSYLIASWNASLKLQV